MEQVSLIGGCVCALFLCAGATDEIENEQWTAIPLDDICAYKMPGTRDIETLSKSVPANELDMQFMSAVLELSFRRAERLKFKDVARPGFAVSGSDRSALHAAFAVFLDWGARREEFSPDDEITIVFFSEPISRYPVQIRQVIRNANQIEIQYELVPDIDRGSHVNFALIPLGRLPIGTFHVELRQLRRKLKPVEAKLGFKPLDNEWSRSFLCRPFNFSVTHKGK